MGQVTNRGNSATKENIEGIISALDKNNYTLAREQIDDVRSADNWFNIRKELESRNQLDLILNFNDSVSRLDELPKTENSGSIQQAQILLKDFDKMVQTLGQPVIDIPRLLIVTLNRNTNCFRLAYDTKGEKQTEYQILINNQKCFYI